MKLPRLAILGIFVVAAASMGTYIGRGNLELNILNPVKDRKEIQMIPEGFDPKEVNLYEGNDVCFVNADTVERWPASNIHPTHGIYPEFDPKGPVAVGEEWCFTFELPGIWRFHDHLLPQFSGIVTVKDK
ncbi:hypothetical protein HYZ99_05770 [Candidatus Peregrinibacteria bacterium]|nr:hypothetical protein [Candidatus Peregrinibacteria bacterium]